VVLKPFETATPGKVKSFSEENDPQKVSLGAEAAA